LNDLGIVLDYIQHHQCATFMAHRSEMNNATLIIIIGAVVAAVGAIAAMNTVSLLLNKATNGPRVNRGVHALHTGPGVFDDFLFLFDENACALLPAEALEAYHAKFEYYFRIDVATFKFLHKKLKRDMRPRRQDARGRRGIKTELLMATALMYLATGNTYSSVSLSMRNGITEASVMRGVRLFTRAVNRKLGWVITFPTTRAGLEQNAHFFERRSLIPNIVGAIDGSHIKVPPPKRDETSYYNRKSFHSVILQAIVDPRGYFMSVDVGFPGRMADPKVLRYTEVYRRAMQWFGRFGFYIYGEAAQTR